MPRKKKSDVVDQQKSTTKGTVVGTATQLPNPSPPPTANLPVARKFQYQRLSASMMKTFLSCRRKFHKNYVEGAAQESKQEFSLGTAVHAAFEAANRSLKDKPRQLNPFEIEDYVQVFREKLASLYLTDMGLFSLGEEIVREELSNLDPKLRVVGVEHEFDLMTPEGVRIYGFIDKLEEVNSTTIKVVDYKSSVMPMTKDEAQKDEQLALYDLAISILFPQYETRILELRYVRSGDSVTVVRSDVEHYNFRRQVLAVHKAITDYMTSVNSSASEAPKGQLNTYCAWCSYRHSCPVYVGHRTSYLPSDPMSTEITDETFISTWEGLSAVQKALEEHKDFLKLWITRRLEENPDLPVIEGGKKVSMTSATRREYDISTIGKLIPLEDLLGKSTDGEPLVKITNKKLENYLKVKNNPKLQAKVEQAVTINFNSPSVRIGKV